MKLLTCCLVGAILAAGVAAAPQNPDSDYMGKKYPSPSGGTPEPTSMLLLAGGAAVYGSMRFRKRSKQDAKKES